MKQQDIAIILVVVVISAGASLGLTKVFFAPSKSKQQTTQTVTPISSTFDNTDKAIYNSEAINPTQLIRIGDGAAAPRF